MARLVADIDDELYKRFKIIAMRENKSMKDKLVECIVSQCYDKLYETKYIDKNEIKEILEDYDSAQINLIDGHMIGYSHKRDPLIDEEVLAIIYDEDIKECKELGLSFDKWLCDLLNETDFAKTCFVKFITK